jgi:hypothetical protein
MWFLAVFAREILSSALEIENSFFKIPDSS